MDIVNTISQLRETLHLWKKQGDRIAFVPTMGNLHAGHIQLVSEAKRHADKVVVSIFVNPTQFGVGEDFESYPRTEKQDKEKLTQVSTDLLFLPSVAEIYPHYIETTISVPELSKQLCGKSRPTHFNGVATVVTKLFNIVQPDLAFFGEKDFQQLTIIKKIVSDLNIPIEIIGAATKRESDGLAMSSRNAYLTIEERKRATQLYISLCQTRNEILSSTANLRKLENKQKNYLTSLGFSVDYFFICQQNNLQLAEDKGGELVILVAAKLGKTRLIDNLYFSKSPTLKN